MHKPLPATHTPAALAGLRVLDLSGPMGNYCGKLFGDLGADVILVEPPMGTALRREPPYIDNLSGVERSLSYAYFNTSKRGITLDLDTHRGQDLFRRLVCSADVIIETEVPGVMASRGLAFEELSALRSQLVMVSITAFGQIGPYALFNAEDIVALAMGGMLYIAGYPDTAPARAYGNQAYLCASMYGAVSAMIAVLEAEDAGRGQHVDVSMQECVILGQENAVQFYDLEGTIRKRSAGEGRFAGYGMFECQDGHIYMLAGGIGDNKFWSRTVQWLMEEKVAGAEKLLGDEWRNPDYLRTDEAKAAFRAIFTPWSKTRTKTYLFHEGQRHHVPVTPVNTPADVLKSRQLEYRGFFVELEHHLRSEPMIAPGAPYKLSETPWRIERPAPRLGEHNTEILGELGVDDAELARLSADSVI